MNDVPGLETMYPKPYNIKQVKLSMHLKVKILACMKMPRKHLRAE